MRILLAVNHLLLGDILEYLLSNIPAVCVWRAANVNAYGLLQALDQHQPEIIVLDNGLTGENLPHLLHQLLNHDHARIILVNNEENQVHIYDKSTATLSQVADFIALTTTINRLGNSSISENLPQKVRIS